MSLSTVIGVAGRDVGLDDDEYDKVAEITVKVTIEAIRDDAVRREVYEKTKASIYVSMAEVRAILDALAEVFAGD